jgi:hypothetical protein
MVSRRKPRCQIPISQQRCWITSSTIYRTQKARSRAAAWSLNRGSRVPESIFSSISCSTPQSAWSRGRRRFQIRQPLLRVTPNVYSSVAPEAIMEADADVGGWITGFSHVEYLGLDGQRRFASGSSSLSLFRGFSPIKSLHLVFNNLYILPPRVFTLILSFPLLEDLTVSTPYEISADDDDDDSDGLSTAVQPSSSPMFTGSLNLLVGEEGMKSFTHRLLSLSGGIHFRKLTLMWPPEEDLSSVVALVEACSHTLESLEVSDLRGTSVLRLRSHP